MSRAPHVSSQSPAARSVIASQFVEELAGSHDPNIADAFQVDEVMIARHEHVGLRSGSQGTR
jgi:hypothetical protein